VRRLQNRGGKIYSTRGQRERGRRNSQIRCESDCEKRHPGPIWVFLILFALFHAIFDFISPAARSNGQGKAAAPILYLLRARGWIDRLTLSFSPSRTSERRELLCRQERIIFGLWIEGSSYSICKHSCNLNFALLYFFHHPLRRHSALSLPQSHSKTII
jgi:hypothetical protein